MILETIPDQAVEAATAAYWQCWSDDKPFKERMGQVIAAAAPYLARPRTITTAEELDALPDDSLVLASGKTLHGEFTNCWIRPVPTSISGSTERRVWEALIYFSDDGYHNMTAGESISFPATVLYEPETGE